MAVIQENKGKVRPMIDFRELNTHIEAFTADSVCGQTAGVAEARSKHIRD